MTHLSQSNLNQVIKFNRLTREVSTVDELFNEALGQMETIFAAPASMFTLRPEGSLIATFDRYMAHGLQEGFFRAYSCQGPSLDPFARALLSQPGIELQREVRTGDELVPYVELLETPFYWQLMHPYDIHHMLRLELVINRRSIATVGLFRPRNTSNFSETDSTKAMLVTAALASALDRALQRERHREDFSILEKSASMMSRVGLIILDEHLSAIYCDTNARERCNIVANSDGPTGSSFILPPAVMGPIRSFWERFQKDGSANKSEEEFLISVEQNAQPTKARVCAQRTIYGRWRILVFLAEEQQEHCPMKWLAGLGLTRREAETVQLVVAGLKNSEIAERLSISINTVQCHLHTIFDKLGTRSRAELIMKVAVPPNTAFSHRIR